MLESHYYKDMIEAGCDEAGRGCLAGSVYAAAVILPPDYQNPDLNDSKKLSPKKREEIYEKLILSSDYAVSFISEKMIDEINILNATKTAMKNCVESLKIKPDVLLIDAVKLNTEIEELPIIKGDAKSYSIAAASIIAKVERDRFMMEMGKKYPLYKFEKNKGYGSKEHVEAIKQYGICEIHRRSFVKNFI